MSLVECDRWPHGSGGDLINVYLSESRVEEAWRAARRFGAGSGWRELAEASAALRPREAAELYRPEIEARLVHANTAAYPEVARLLADRQRLSAAAGEADGFEEYLAELRDRYARRPSLLKALKAQGL